MNNQSNIKFLSNDNKVFDYAENGLSNTHSLVTKTCCFDYLKMGLNSNIFNKTQLLENLLNILKLNSFDYDIKNLANYAEGRIYDEDIAIGAGGETTKSKNGEETSFVELKGQALRRFELRGGSYLELFTFFIKNGFHCLRIDIPIDDFSNSISKLELEKKIKNRDFQTRLVSRSVKISIDTNSDSASSDNIVIDNRNKGWSITIGGRTSRQLCIYDKKAERDFRGFDYFGESWMRYESRFYHESSQYVFLKAYQALINNMMPEFSLQLLRGIIEFKSHHDWNNRMDLKRATTWSKWKAFTNDVNPIFIQNQGKLESTILSKKDWIDRCVSNSLIKLYLCNTDLFINEIGKVMTDTKHIERSLTSKGVSEINNYRISKGYNPLTKEQCLEIITMLKDSIGGISMDD